VCRPFILILAFLADVALLHQPSFALPVGAKSHTVEQHSLAFSDHDVRVFVRGPGGASVDQVALVILTSLQGEVQEAETQAGYAEFAHVREGWYDVEIVAPGYDRTNKRIELAGPGPDSFTVTLKVASGPHAPTDTPAVPILAPKAKKELGKAQEALHAGKLTEARNHLDTVYRLAPANPDVNYVFGIYFIETNELEKARGHLEKAVNLDPRHARALQALGIVFLRRNTPVESVPYLKRALEAEPTSWRSHALLAEVWLRMGLVDDSVKQSERALELGHGPAAVVEPLLARALARRGETERAIQILEKYLKEHSSDAVATKQLQDLRTVSRPKLTTEAQVTSVELPLVPQAPLTIVAPFFPSSWLPPDIDETIPPVEPNIPCARDEVLKNAGERVREFVSNVNRFTATETIQHETINRWGLASSPETLKFDYLVSIEEVRRESLNVDEFRSSAYSGNEFPDGIVAHGLPSLLLIFHPYSADKYEMTCEGLAHWNGGLAWQMHFRQRGDRPSTNRSYMLGENGPSYPAALKGRAWIAADSGQIIRLEIDLVHPIPEIRLVADHTVVEYGPVNFRKRAVQLWLPQTAEFYYDWRGHRGHRVHRFTNYLLFSVDDKQRISAPNTGDESPTAQ
jgi:tetratricopeptide (TPR) repeat protein